MGWSRQVRASLLSRRLPLASLALLFAAAQLESSLALHLDRTLPLWDKPIHAAAGAAVARLPRGRPGVAVALALATGVLWELGQALFLGIPASADMYWLDTSTDVIADLAGALAAVRRVRSGAHARASFS